MTYPDLSNFSGIQLLTLYGRLLSELRARDVVRTANNPVADYTESLFCKTFDWKRAAKQSVGHDAIDSRGVRFEIKGRRQTRKEPSRKLGIIRKLDTFDYLAAALLNEDFSVHRAAIVPVHLVAASPFSTHTNGHGFILKDEVWNLEGVIDATPHLVAHVAGESTPFPLTLPGTTQI